MSLGALRPRSAAFFDVDGTLLRGFIIRAFPIYLAERGLFPRAAAEELDRVIESYERGQIAYREIAEGVPELIASGLKGCAVAEVEAQARDFMEGYVLTHEYGYARPLVRWVKNRVDLNLAISGSPIEPTRELAPFGFHELYGTVFEQESGVYTGRVGLNLILSESKAQLIGRLIRIHRIDPARSYAFGDTDQDSPMLEAVGFPLALNPNKALRGVCAERGWPWLTRKELAQPWQKVRNLIRGKLEAHPR